MEKLMFYVLFCVSILSGSSNSVANRNRLFQDTVVEKEDEWNYKSVDVDATKYGPQRCRETWGRCSPPPAINNRPIIGVLAQRVVIEKELRYGDTYLMASYVSFLEMAGARVVPVRVGESKDYYTSLFKNINGVLFPGGSVSILNSNYAKAARLIFDLAKEANDAGDYFPLHGVCLGHELFSALVTGKNWLRNCDAEKLMLPLRLSPDARKSRLLQWAPENTLDIMTNYNVTANMHHECLTPENFTKSGLDQFFQVISTDKDRQGTTFISTMEAKKYPFYTTQWHPEKNVFTWDVHIPLNHTEGAVHVTQYFANFFVSEARRSGHQFPDLQTEGAALIQNYDPVYLGPPAFDLNYYFNLTTTSQP